MATDYGSFNWPGSGSSSGITSTTANMFTPACDLALASVTSTVFNVDDADNVGMVAAWTGDGGVAGYLLVEVSNDGTDWSRLTFNNFLTPIQLGTNSGTLTIALREMPFSQVRVTYQNNGGTGTLQISITIKG